MIAFYFFLKNLFGNLRLGLKEPEFRGLFYSVLAVLIVGTIFYNQVEGWSILDSFYFTVVALTTVGFGDFSPQTEVGKVFTIIYLIIGLGLLSSFIIQMAQLNRERSAGPRMPDRFRRKPDSTAADPIEEQEDQTL